MYDNTQQSNVQFIASTLSPTITCRGTNGPFSSGVICTHRLTTVAHTLHQSSAISTPQAPSVTTTPNSYHTPSHTPRQATRMIWNQKITSQDETLVRKSIRTQVLTSTLLPFLPTLNPYTQAPCSPLVPSSTSLALCSLLKLLLIGNAIRRD